MVLFDGERDARLIESSIARYGESVTLGDGSTTEAIPVYEDALVQLPNGETTHLEGWFLSFRKTVNLVIGHEIQWRSKRWKANDTFPMNTKLRCMVSEVPVP